MEEREPVHSWDSQSSEALLPADRGSLGREFRAMRKAGIHELQDIHGTASRIEAPQRILYNSGG